MISETASKSAPGTIPCVPVPGWVEHLPYTMQADGDACIGNGTCRLLQETQVDLTGDKQGWHYRNAQRILTRAGAENAANFIVDIDPAYQRLEVHFIRVVRGADRIEHAAPTAFQVFRRETNLERLALNGRLTVSLLIPDVRIDDVVEIALTIYGSNPALAGKYAAWIAFDPFNPWREVRLRVRKPPARTISVKPFNQPPGQIVTERDGVEEWHWSYINQPKRQPDEFAPPWLLIPPGLQFSEYRDWNDVARLFAPHYDSPGIPETLAAEIDQLAEKHPDPAARAAEWLHFIQEKLRYFALALGEGNLVPRQPDVIWAGRFGDCKDATQLYVAGARRLGLDACAALVATQFGPSLDQTLPSPTLFNHCIVRLRLGDVSYWLDPTIQSQAETLENITQPHSGWALPLTAETEALEKMGSDRPVHHLHYEEDVTFGPKRNSPAALRRRIVFRSSTADAMRNHVANQGAGEYAKAILKDLKSIWPDVVETAPLAIQDDRAMNCLTATATYEIRDCWQSGKGHRLEFKIADLATPRELGIYKGGPRATDIYLGRPRKVTRKTSMDMPKRWLGEGWVHQRRVPGANYVSRLEFFGRHIVADKELLVTATTLPGDKADDYAELVTQLHQNILIIRAYERFGRIGSAAGGRLGLTRGVLSFILTALWVAFILFRLISILKE